MNENHPENDDSSSAPASASAKLLWRNKRYAIVAGVIIAIVTVAASIVVVISAMGNINSNDGKDSAASKTGSQPHCGEAKKTGVTKPEAQPDAGGIEIVDEGHATSKKLENDHNNFGHLGAGAILINSSDLVAYDVEVTLRATWPNGDEVRSSRGDKPWKYGPWHIGSIGPGQRFGLGFFPSVINERLGPNQDIELKADISVKEWWQVDNDVHDFEAITAKLDYSDGRDDAESKLSFTIDSQYCDAVGDVRVAVVYRDSKDKIIGGWTDLPLSLAKGADLSEVESIDAIPPGKTANVLVDNMWSDIAEVSDFSTEPDLAKTEIYAYFEPDSKG